MDVGDLVTRQFNSTSDFISIGIVVERLSRHVVTVYWYKVDKYYAAGKSDEAVQNLETLSKAPKKTIDKK